MEYLFVTMYLLLTQAYTTQADVFSPPLCAPLANTTVASHGLVSLGRQWNGSGFELDVVFGTGDDRCAVMAECRLEIEQRGYRSLYSLNIEYNDIEATPLLYLCDLCNIYSISSYILYSITPFTMKCIYWMHSHSNTGSNISENSEEFSRFTRIFTQICNQRSDQVNTLFIITIESIPELNQRAKWLLP